MTTEAERKARRAEQARMRRAADPEKSRVASRKYRAAHPDRVRGAQRRWYEAHPDYHANWRANHPEAVRTAWRKTAIVNREQRRQWARDHLELRRVWWQNYHANKMNAAGTSSRDQVQARIDLYGGRCWICGGGRADSIDHVIPLSRGGTNWPANLRPAHKKCNSRKSDIWPFDALKTIASHLK